VAGNGYAHERENVMLRNFGISLLLLGLLAAGIDGFRVRDRVQTGASDQTATEEGLVHSAEAGIFIPPAR
jgi:hypothetical protein